MCREFWALRTWLIFPKNGDRTFYGKALLIVLFIYDRVNSPNSGCLPSTGYKPLYTMVNHFAAFGPIMN